MTTVLKKILYIEDDENIAEIAIMAMQSIGKFEVQHFLSAKEALANLDNLEPQMILLDMMMPEMDGLTFFEELQKYTKFKKIPTIFITARIQNDEIKNYLAKGARGVIAKPFDPMELCNSINKLWKE